MKRVTSMSIAALVAATIALGAAAPVIAGDHGPRGPRGDFAFRMDPDGNRMFARGQMRGEARGGILALVCSERGDDRLEHRLLSISQRAEPAGDQVALYEAFKTAATAAQADFAKACDAALPEQAAGADADLVDRLKARLELDEARLAGMSAVLPAFEAFYDSLSDEQQKALAPRLGERGERLHDMRRGPRSGGPLGQPLNS